jgi:flagellar hook assembly protein FlgD
MTRISYTLNRDTWVTLKVYDLLGREVATLVDELQRAGLKSVVWEGRRDNGISVASGVYVYRLSAVDFTVSRMMLLTK